MKLICQVAALALLICSSEISSAKTLKVMVLYTVTECTELTAGEFQKSSGHKVVVHSLPTEDYLRIVDSNQYLGYDVYEIWYVMMPDYVKRSVLLNLSGAFDQGDLDDFFPNVLKHYGYVGNDLYAIPYDGDCHFLYYRPSLLEKYHLRAPGTWEDYLKVVKLISEHEAPNGIWGTVLMANSNPFNVTTLFYNRLAWNGEVESLTDAKIERALRAMKDIMPYAHPDSLKANYKMTRALFLGGKVAMLEQYNDLSIRADDKTQSAIKGDWQAGMLPRWKGDVEFPTAMNGGFGLGVNRLSRNSKIAIEFIKFATSARMQKMRSMRNCGVEPTRISVLSDPEYYSYSVNSNLFAATYRHITPWKKDVRDTLDITNILHKFMTGETDIVNTISSLRGPLTQ